MSIQIPADTTLRVETHHDGSLTLRFDRKRPLEPETTPIEETEIDGRRRDRRCRRCRDHVHAQTTQDRRV